MNERTAAFLVPLLTAVVLLYQVLATLQVPVADRATLPVIAVTLGVATLGGLLAAFGPRVVRVGVYVACATILLDVTLHLSNVFEQLTPDNRVLLARDRQRVADLHRIQAAIDEYAALHGRLPAPVEYGEGVGPETFWNQWWDLSAHDGSGSNRPFLGFLQDDGLLDDVPVDPVNEEGTPGDPRDGRQYVYFLVPPDYEYAGGVCAAAEGRWVYLLGITDLEYESARPPRTFGGSGCECLWRDQPGYFEQFFDYVLCGFVGGKPPASGEPGGAPEPFAAGARPESQGE